MPKITITTDHPASSYGQPVCLINNELVKPSTGLRYCLRVLNWTQETAAQRCGKSVSAIRSYCQGLAPVPAEVWIIVSNALAAEDKQPPIQLL